MLRQIVIEFTHIVRHIVTTNRIRDRHIHSSSKPKYNNEGSIVYFFVF